MQLLFCKKFQNNLVIWNAWWSKSWWRRNLVASMAWLSCVSWKHRPGYRTLLYKLWQQLCDVTMAMTTSIRHPVTMSHDITGRKSCMVCHYRLCKLQQCWHLGYTHGRRQKFFQGEAIKFFAQTQCKLQNLWGKRKNADPLSTKVVKACKNDTPEFAYCSRFSM